MTVTVYVDGWHEQPHNDEKFYLCDRYSSLCEEDFELQGYQKDTDGRRYDIERVYSNPFPAANLSNGNWRGLAIALDFDTESNAGSVSVEGIPGLIRKCLHLINSTARYANASRPAKHEGNMIQFGVSEAHVADRARDLLSILKFAQSLGKGGIGPRWFLPRLPT